MNDRQRQEEYKYLGMVDIATQAIQLLQKNKRTKDLKELSAVLNTTILEMERVDFDTNMTSASDVLNLILD